MAKESMTLRLDAAVLEAAKRQSSRLRIRPATYVADAVAEVIMDRDGTATTATLTTLLEQVEDMRRRLHDLQLRTVQLQMLEVDGLSDAQREALAAGAHAVVPVLDEGHK